MPVTTAGDAFIDALRFGAYFIQARLTVYQFGVQVGQFVTSVSNGSFTVDRNSEFRRTGSLTIEVLPVVPPGPTTPVNPSSLLAPFGTEVFVETGISSYFQNVELAVQWVPNGLFAISTTVVDDTTVDMTVTLDLYDRSWTIAQRVLKNPYNFPATSSGNFVSEIKAILNQVWGEQAPNAPLVYNIVPTQAVVPQASYNQGSDPWQAALDMAAAVGYELFFDVNGVVVGRPIPDPFTTPVTWNFTDDQTVITGLPGTGSGALLGGPYSTPVEVSLEMTRDGIYNDIVIQGTGDANAATYSGTGLEVSGSPILAEAADTNPDSPTYIFGGMGDVTNFVSSSLVTKDGAQDMADTDLQQALSSAWGVTFSAPPNPIFDVDDVVTLTRPRVGLNAAVVVIDTITHTFNYADLMQLTGRILTNEVVT